MKFWQFVSCTICLFGLTVQSSAVERSCQAAYKVVNLNRNMVTVHVESFRAFASARTYIPNTLRKRAYRKAMRCMRTHWAHRSHYETPVECTHDSGIRGYETEGLYSEINRRACSEWNATGRVRVRIYGYVWGKNGCGGEYGSNSRQEVLVNRYYLSC